MQLKKSIIALALTSSLAACGGSSSSTPDPIKPDPAPVAVETVVDGKAVKGVLTNAVVTVYKFVDGAPVALTSAELKETNITTDSQGNYSFTVLDYTGPIKVELTPSTDTANPTTMICDAPAGCADKAFGEKIDLTTVDPNFKLSAMSAIDSSNSSSVVINASALTHLATKLIEADSNGVSNESVIENSAKIASAFGIEGNITQLEPTVTNDASSVAAEDNEAELRYGLINAGIMSAIFANETENTAILSSKIAEISADLVESGGALLVNQDEDSDFELALSDVLEGAAEAAEAAAEAILSDDTLTATIDLVQLETNFANEQAYQEANVGDDGRAEVVVDVPTDGDAIAKAKGMVEDVRLFTHLFDEETDQGAGFKSQGDEYVELLNEAGAMVASEVKSFELLGHIAEALGEISMQYDDGTLSPEVAAAGVSINNYLPVEGATGIVTFDEETASGGLLFNVEANAGNETFNFHISAEFAEDKKSITIAINGLLESAGAVFTLTEGSFAKVNFDTEASRDSIENDTFEGEIISGELDLSLSIAQKATDTVPNPVTFEGMINTKLLPVKERTFNHHWEWNEQSESGDYTFSRPKFETVVLPETLSLSGAFSSLEGDLVSATLTVNLKDLEGYDAPDFKYTGKEIASLLNITFTDDAVTWTEADSVIDEEQATITHGFTAQEQAGHWTGSRSYISKNAELHWAGSGYELKHYSRPFDAGLDVDGILYTYGYVIGRDENNFWAKSVRITPVDEDNNGQADGYHVERISTSDGQQVGLEYNIEAMLDSDGNINLSALIDAEGQILTADGQPQDWTNALNLETHASIDAFIEQRPWELITHPLELSNTSDYFALSVSNENVLSVEGMGQASIFFSNDEIEDIAAGKHSELNPTAYLTQPLIEDALAVTVSEDKNTVSYAIKDALSRNFTFQGEGSGNFIANIEQKELTPWHSETIYKTISSSTHDIGLSTPEVTLNISYSYSDDYSYVHQIIITPNDDNEDGEIDQFIARHGYGDRINDEGVLISGEDSVVAIDMVYAVFDSYDNVQWNEPNFSNDVPFNPLDVSNALDVFKEVITNESYSPDVYVEGIGKLEVNLSEEDLASIVANSTTTFDANNTEADSTSILEDENTFLNVNAALTLEAILGDYQVKLQLSGVRAALDDGAFDLGMSYRLPGEESQRSFTVHYNTEEEGKLTANNFEGVVLVLEEPAADAQGTQVLGQILVGPSAVVAATIEERSGLVVIVYSDGTTESL